MSLRDRAREQHPDFPWLDLARPETIVAYLERSGWLAPGEVVERCVRAGEGNMNLTARVETSRRIVVLKQSRPWVEKYDDIAAPWDRILSEQRFYARAARLPEVGQRMPSVLGHDADARTLLLEFLPGARDFSGLYAAAAEAPDDGEIDALAHYLAALHEGTRGAPDEGLRNRAMRALNHAHVFEIPLAPDNPVALDELEPGLAAAVKELAADGAYRTRSSEVAARYQADGECLLHGDYFPGSWLRSDHGLRVIDPEFAYFGDPEWDLGVACAHLALAGLPSAGAERLLARYGDHAPTPRGDWLARYAAAETMRRIAGVAQLPIPPSNGPDDTRRRSLLARSRDAMMSGEILALWR